MLLTSRDALLQGIENLTHEEACKIAGENPDFAKKDLYEAIERGEFPSWTFYVQVSSLLPNSLHHKLCPRVKAWKDCNG